MSVSYFVNICDPGCGIGGPKCQRNLAPDEFSPVIALYENNTFSMTVNLYVGKGTVSGTYLKNNGEYSFTVLKRSFSGFIGDDVNSFKMLRTDNGDLEFNRQQIGTTDSGSIFIHSESRPISFIPSR